MPAGGYLFGVTHCTDCGSSILGRIFIGFVFAVLTPFTFGFPPRNEGGVGAPYNGWPYIIVAALVIFAVTAGLLRRKHRPHP
jgi:hypothetical protein